MDDGIPLLLAIQMLDFMRYYMYMYQVLRGSWCRLKQNFQLAHQVKNNSTKLSFKFHFN